MLISVFIVLVSFLAAKVIILHKASKIVAEKNKKVGKTPFQLDENVGIGTFLSLVVSLLYFHIHYLCAAGNADLEYAGGSTGSARVKGQADYNVWDDDWSE